MRYWHYYEAYNVSQCLCTLDSGNTMPCASSWLFGAVLMYFQLGRLRTYTCTDFRVWRSNYGILTTNANPVIVPRSDAVTTGLNVLYPFAKESNSDKK